MNPLSPVKQVLRSIFIASLVLASSTFMVAQHQKVLHAFAGTPDGQYPWGGLVSDKHGNLYGTTENGGAFGEGAVFELARSGDSWNETVLYSFYTNPNDGYHPRGNLIVAANGDLYGSTIFGGAYNGGTVFELNAPTVSGGSWSETIIYNAPLNGSTPSTPCGLVWSNRRLYGITMSGGIGYGSIVELTPPATSGGSWQGSTVYSFAGGADGRNPGLGYFTSLIADSAGNLYGTTETGGSGQSGTVFQLVPPAISGGQWTKNILHNFPSGSNDGASPYGTLAFDSHGNLFGTTSLGGTNGYGTVYELAFGGEGIWNESVVYNFGSFTGDGVSPIAGVLFDKAGNMYGTTQSALNKYWGTVWKLTPPSTSGGSWSETLLHGFSGGHDGGEPLAPVIAGPNGVLYGTTSVGGNSNSDGVAYQVIP